MDKVVLRYEGLDYLRGLCALSILLYHYVEWTMRGLDISNPLGKLGVYGVSMFYVLSGLTMYLVYYKSFSLNKSFLKSFYLKRFFRIYPLMWLIMILSILFVGFKGSIKDLFIQFTGLFGIVDWAASVPAGMWSIGNELCFYLMLPIFFYCMKRGTISLVIMTSVTFCIYLYFAFFLFDKTKPISVQDTLYKNPLCQAGLFLGGILIGYFFKEQHFNKKSVLLLLLVFSLIFIFYPVTGNAINIIAGPERIIYTLICFGITFCFFKGDFSYVAPYLKKTLEWLGEISYSLYLLHPLIWSLIALSSLKIRFVFPLAVIATFVICSLIYKFIEQPARNLGLKINNKK